MNASWLQNWRRWTYPLLLVIIYTAYVIYMMAAQNWSLYQEHWAISVTMTGGSFIAGATAEGGAAIAFPVFTKVLQIPANEARTFGLMIQAAGMTMASVVIFLRRIPFLHSVVLWVTLGGILGQFLGTFFLIMPAPYPRILFTFIAAAFGVALAISRWLIIWDPRTIIRNWHNSQRFRFVLLGVVGGAFAAQTGSGIDMLTFIVLTLAFGINEKISTPTTVIIMALNSIAGIFFRFVGTEALGNGAELAQVWEYWLVAVPIVIVGAPLGATVASYLKRDHIIVFLLSLITLEVVTTIWLVPFTTESLIITAIVVAICAVWFRSLLKYRAQSIAPIMRTMEIRALSPEDLANLDFDFQAPLGIDETSGAGRKDKGDDEKA
jgi:uncharacterized membrane protein YfcA